jgi:hypothetical protein
MNLNEKELRTILKWFDIAQDNLEDEDLKLYDKIIDYVDSDLEDEEEEEDFSFEYDDDSDFDYSDEEDD